MQPFTSYFPHFRVDKGPRRLLYWKKFRNRGASPAKEGVALKKRGSLWKKVVDTAADTSPVMQTAGRIALLAVGNLLWLVCSLPVVTAGAAAAGLYTVLFDRVTFDQAPGAFFRGWRQRWKTATTVWLPVLAVGAVLGGAWRIVATEQLTNAFFPTGPLLLVTAVWAIVAQWLLPVLCIRGGSWTETFRDAALLGLGELWRSAVMAAADGACLLAFAWCAFSRSVTACGLWALFGFSLAAAVKVWLARPVLCPKEE